MKTHTSAALRPSRPESPFPANSSLSFEPVGQYPRKSLYRVTCHAWQDVNGELLGEHGSATQYSPVQHRVRIANLVVCCQMQYRGRSACICLLAISIQRRVDNDGTSLRRVNSLASIAGSETKSALILGAFSMTVSPLLWVDCVVLYPEASPSV